jgi:mannitol/fructose-specific phosphotransferase system IIA component (Ntr-type)
VSTPNVELPPSVSVSHEATIKFLVGQLVQSGRLQPDKAENVVCQLLRRESLGSTAIGNGYAFPHSKSDAVSQVLGIVGFSASPIAWPGAVDDLQVYVVCLFITPDLAPGTHLRALEAFVRDIR